MVERLYERWGRRYLYLLLAAAALSIPLLTVPATGIMFLYDDASGADHVQGLVVAIPWMVLVGILAEVAVARTMYRPILRWLETGRGVEGAAAAWRAAVNRLGRAVLLGGTIVLVLAVPVEVYYAQKTGLNGIMGTLGLIAGVSAFIAVGGALHYLAWEYALRPLVADIAQHLSPDFAGGRSTSLGAILLFLIPVLNVLTGSVAAAMSTDSLGPAGKIAVGIGTALLFSATIAVGLTVLLRNSLTRPLELLLGAMQRVERGDLEAHVPMTTGDELGVVTHHFNTMLLGLQDRRRLAEEREALLEDVRASRARIVTASDAERRRIERNIHDGAQQQLVGLALQVQLLKETEQDPDRRASLDRAGEELSQALAELRDLARGLHPQVLSVGGLAAALRQLADRSPVPVTVDSIDDRFPETVESTAYFVASEALANVAKYAQASAASVVAERRNGSLVVRVSDDGVGGADARSGSGLAGLADRIAALDGTLEIDSPPGRGTTVRVELPVA